MPLLPSSYAKVMHIMVNHYAHYDEYDLYHLYGFCKVQSVVFRETKHSASVEESIRNVADECRTLNIAVLLPDVFYTYLHDCLEVINSNYIKFD
jgi:hypothetical protein